MSLLRPGDLAFQLTMSVSVLCAPEDTLCSSPINLTLALKSLQLFLLGAACKHWDCPLLQKGPQTGEKETFLPDLGLRCLISKSFRSPHRRVKRG